LNPKESIYLGQKRKKKKEKEKATTKKLQNY